MAEIKGLIKCNCTVCGSRFRVKVDREGNVRHDANYCVFCRSMLEDVEDLRDEDYIKGKDYLKASEKGKD
jgi:hypothetical protein